MRKSSIVTLLPLTNEQVNAFARVCLSVCLSFCMLARFLKTRAWISMKCCVSTDVGTWTNWLTFEPDPDYDPDAATGLLSPLSYKRRALVREILRRENPTYTLGRCSDTWFYNVSFTKAVSRRNTFVGGTCAPPSAQLLVGHRCCLKLIQ